MVNMTATKKASFLVAIIATVALAVFATALVSAGSITEIEVNGIEVVDTSSDVTVAGFYRDTVPVRVQFTSDSFEEETRLKAWFSGSRSNSATTERFDILPDVAYSRVVSVPLPDDFDNDVTEEDFILNIVIESRNGGVVASETIKVFVQRESFVIDILDVDMSNDVSAGEVLALDVVIKNRGRQFAEDSFVVARIPALGIEDRAYFGDLSSVDTSDPDKEDASERRLFLRVPTSAQPGVYTVEVEAFNEDSVTSTTRKVSVSGVSEDTTVVAPVHTKSFNVGKEVSYSMTIVNAGNRVRVYELVVDSSGDLDLDVSEPVIAVPAGSSRTVQIMAEADKGGKHTFGVNIHSDGQVVKQEQFTANVEGSRVTSAGNATVLLTVILAIIFVVLLVVLIVLLTKKPEKSEEFGESYY